MRISNNQKGMTTHILGLFLTAAMPLSLSLMSAPSAMAAMEDDLTQSIVVSKLPLSSQLSLIVKPDEEQKVPTIRLNKEGKVSTYNIGHALHDFQAVLKAKENDVFLNELLQHFRAEDPTTSQERAANIAAKMIYQCFRFTVELVANRTADRNLDTLILNWEAARRGYDITVTSLAYQNILKKVLVDQAAELEQAIGACREKNTSLDSESLATESQLAAEHEKAIKSLKDKKANTATTIEGLEKKFKEKEKPTVYEGQEHQKNRKIHEETLQGLNNDIEVAQSKFAKEKKEREEELARKKAENELIVEELKSKHASNTAKFVEDFSFIFEDLGGSWGMKTLGRLWKGKSANREAYNYAPLDGKLIQVPDLLANAKSLILLKILAVSEKAKSTPLVFDESEILEALLKHLGITDQPMPSTSNGSLISDGVAGSSTATEVMSIPSNAIPVLVDKVKKETPEATDENMKQKIAQRAFQQLVPSSTRGEGATSTAGQDPKKKENPRKDGE